MGPAPSHEAGLKQQILFCARAQTPFSSAFFLCLLTHVTGLSEQLHNRRANIVATSGRYIFEAAAEGIVMADCSVVDPES
jgi:hypothetical protein